MKPEVHIFNDTSEMATRLAENIVRYINQMPQKKQSINIVLSGGKTPEIFYRRLSSLAAVQPAKTNWEIVHFFWGDERCVPPTHSDSNYGLANRTLLRTLDIPLQNIHRIKGENNPADEALRYSNEIRTYVRLRNGTPYFDWILLGLGEDGHTASIFPDQLNLLYSAKDCEVAVHPVTGEKRITLTGKVLINAAYITFLVAGSNKKQKVMEIVKEQDNAKKYPAWFIKPVSGKLEWLLDSQAAGLIGF